jgi:hypothetical protein
MPSSADKSAGPPLAAASSSAVTDGFYIGLALMLNTLAPVMVKMTQNADGGYSYNKARAHARERVESRAKSRERRALSRLTGRPPAAAFLLLLRARGGRRRRAKPAVVHLLLRRADQVGTSRFFLAPGGVPPPPPSAEHSRHSLARLGTRRRACVLPPPPKIVRRVCCLEPRQFCNLTGVGLVVRARRARLCPQIVAGCSCCLLKMDSSKESRDQLAMMQFDFKENLR